MLLSTAIPIVIAAIVIVIMSNGIFNKPIIPQDKKCSYKIRNYTNKGNSNISEKNKKHKKNTNHYNSLESIFEI